MDIDNYYNYAKAIYEGKDLNGNPINTNTEAKTIAYNNLISEIENIRPNIDYCKDVFADFSLNDLFNQKKSIFGFRRFLVEWPFDKSHEVIAIINNIINFHTDFQQYGNETSDQIKEREKKLAEYNKPLSELNPTKDKAYQHNPDRIYLPKHSLYGIYTFWYEYHTDRFYQLFWRLWHENKNENDFVANCRLFCLYIALVNELITTKNQLAQEQTLQNLYNKPTAPETGNKKLDKILNRAIREDFIMMSENGYKWNSKKAPLQYAYYFAECAEDKKICTKADIKSVLNIKYFYSYKNRLTKKNEKALKKERELKCQINSLFY